MLALLVCLAVGASASYSSSTVSSSSSLTLSASVSYELSSAAYCDESIYSIGSELSTLELSTPSLYMAESVIASYEYSSPSIVSDLESDMEYPSAVTSLTQYYYDESEYSNLATAIATLINVEETSPTLAADQSSLQTIMQSDSSILYDLSEYTDVYSPSVVSASEVIDEATIVSSGAFEDAISLSLDISSFYSLESNLASISYLMYSLPSSVDYEVTEFISSPSTMAVSSVSYLYDYYPTVYDFASVIGSYVASYPSIGSAITDYLSVVSVVSSFGSAVSSIEYYQMPTLYVQEAEMSSASSTWSTISTDLGYLTVIEASSPSLSYAFSTLENTFYESPEVASSLYYAIYSPSTVTDTELVSEEEMSHQSFVSALDTVFSFESAYPQYASTLSYILYAATSAFETESTLMTAAEYMEALTSSSVASATYSLSTDLTVISNEDTVLYAVSYATYESSTLSCYEQEIESYAYWVDDYVMSLWSVVESPSLYFAEASYYAELEDSYPSLVYALEYIYSAAYTFTSLYSYESSFIYAAGYDSQLLSDYYYASYSAYEDASYMWWYSSSSSSSSSYY